MINLTIGGTTKRSNNGQTAVEIDWENLPQASREFIVAYGLKQYLADGAAGAQSHDELVQGVAERVRKLETADFQRKGSGAERGDTETTLALKFAREAIRAACKAQNMAAPAKEKLAEMAKGLIESNPKYRKDAQAELARRAKATEAFAGDEAMQALLADMLLGEDESTDEEGE
jgi:hypothetical protein